MKLSVIHAGVISAWVLAHGSNNWDLHVSDKQLIPSRKKRFYKWFGLYMFLKMNYLIFVIIMSIQPRVILSRPPASTPSPNPAPSPIPSPRLKQSRKWNRFQSQLIKSVCKTESNKQFKYQATLYSWTLTITAIRSLWIEEVIGSVKSFHVSLDRFPVSLYGYGKMVLVASTIFSVIEIFYCLLFRIQLYFAME